MQSSRATFSKDFVDSAVEQPLKRRPPGRSAIDGIEPKPELGVIADMASPEPRTVSPMDLKLSVVQTTVSGPLIAPIRRALESAIMDDSKLPPEIFAMAGMSGRKYRTFINNLIGEIEDPRYLEIGVYMGSTLCSALYKNKVRALAIDNWSEFGGPADKFLANISLVKGPESALSFADSDFRKVAFEAIGKFNVYFFDGPHQEHDHHDGVVLAQPALDDHFILIVDDWNWEQVRQGTFAGIREAGLNLDFVAEIFTSLDNTHPALSGPDSDWHNGYFIGACSKSV